VFYLTNKGEEMKKKNIIIIGIIIIVISSFLAYTTYKETTDLKRQLKEEAIDTIVEGKKVLHYLNSPKVEEEVNLEEGYVVVIDTKINTEEKIISLLEEHFTEEFARGIYTSYGFYEEDGEMRKELIDAIFKRDFRSAKIDDIKINPINKKATVELSVVHHYGPDDTEIQKSIVGFELIGSEYKISKINGW
jgi:hypothetical protein